MGTSGYTSFACYGYRLGNDKWLAIDEPDFGNVRSSFLGNISNTGIFLYSEELMR